MSKTNRILFFCGPADLITAHKRWRSGETTQDQLNIPFSVQSEQFCDSHDIKACLISCLNSKETLSDDQFEIEHCPKPISHAKGVQFYLTELLYTLIIIWKAIRFRANYAVIDSGPIMYLPCFILVFFGIKVIPLYHNTVWPKNFYPTSFAQRGRIKSDGLFLKYGAHAIIGVSPECIRQITELTGRQHRVYEIRAQYEKQTFGSVSSEPCTSDRNKSFKILYVGRVIENKGVYDILKIARLLKDRGVNNVHWTLCGTGPDLSGIKALRKQLQLEDTVDIKGWTSKADLIKELKETDASIVPTTQGFAEGLAMTAIESAIFGKPVITNPVVPAAELLGDTALIANTGDIQDYANKIEKLIGDQADYNRRVAASKLKIEDFFNRGKGLKAILEKIIIG